MHSNEETKDIFGNIQLCQQFNTLQCRSIQRINLILIKFRNILQSDISNECKDDVGQVIAEIFTSNYTKTHLLNDFNHIKYHHNADENNEVFANIYKYLTQNNKMNCSASKCKGIERHYQDRSKFSTQYFRQDHEVDFNNEYIFKLITRIHVYFIHSYDINRLSVNE
eukprot:324427_1